MLINLLRAVIAKFLDPSITYFHSVQNLDAIESKIRFTYTNKVGSKLLGLTSLTSEQLRSNLINLVICEVPFSFSRNDRLLARTKKE